MVETPERRRLTEADEGGAPWREWGPYLSERAWGSVREDYSADGDAWSYFPFDHARSRVYRWSEDGLAGLSNLNQDWCFALAFWNGRDPILKERAFGLGNAEGNHGEDAKDYWWYEDATPTGSWLSWRYHYPQGEFPYARLRAENAGRSKDLGEFELVDTGVFDEDRYFVITADYAKASPQAYAIRLTVANQGPETETLHVLPHLWLRNMWAWGRASDIEDAVDAGLVGVSGAPGRLTARHPHFSPVTLADASGLGPEPLLCDNETNAEFLFRGENGSDYPKDGIGDHVVHGAATVNPELEGTKGALHYVLELAPGEERVVYLTLTAEEEEEALVEDVLVERRQEADAFYAEVAPAGASAQDARIMRQAYAGLVWAKQFYHYDVHRWTEGDPAQPLPPAHRAHDRNQSWAHLWARDIILMPDPWEYPWFAAWDLAFHCVAMVGIDPGFAKQQLYTFLSQRYQHPNGKFPAYEWDFDDVNPPVLAWAALVVYRANGHDLDFLRACFHKLLLDFTFWVNRKDAEENNIFEGGFLGLDNIGPFDRSKLPVDGVLEQSDGTGWMGFYCLSMLEISMELGLHDPIYEEMACKFAEHFAYIAAAINDCGLWDEEDGFFYDRLRRGNGSELVVRVRSMVGVIPLLASLPIERATLDRLPRFSRHLEEFTTRRPEYMRAICRPHAKGGILFSLVNPAQAERVMARVADPDEFRSPYGLRSLSLAHRDKPFEADLDGIHTSVDYEPGESRSGLFGGNSNWRGPVWMPMNYLMVHTIENILDALDGTPTKIDRRELASQLRGGLIDLFRPDGNGRRPVIGDVPLFQRDPRWAERPWFYEYFHGDSGRGLGAAHQTGWTALVAELIRS
ncbi:MGH1-like glycoside hydrolase domain-containing protein [Actinospica sp.]|uniref:MGH1-like glycoside hydrolase domain-containing protein n=1 Tax=Actinospica sp. TaxID=1872142 RepID=UPI002BB0824D|nr:glucosidase [Actinospica sp.]HWG25498.1 glucosidase [Actinospica sp.]